MKAIPDPEVVTLESTLTNLSYLSGMIKEGLRLGYGVSSRLQRVPHEPLIFSTQDRDWIIPSGTPVRFESGEGVLELVDSDFSNVNMVADGLVPVKL